MRPREDVNRPQEIRRRLRLSENEKVPLVICWDGSNFKIFGISPVFYMIIISALIAMYWAGCVRSSNPRSNRLKVVPGETEAANHIILIINSGFLLCQLYFLFRFLPRNLDLPTKISKKVIFMTYKISAELV